MSGEAMDWALLAVVGLAGGYFAGMVHFRTLRTVASRLMAGDAINAMVLMAARLAALAVLLIGAAVLGGGIVLVAATAGIMLARSRELRALKVDT